MSVRWVDLAWPDRQGRLRVASVPAEAMAEAARAIAVAPADIGWPGIAGPLTLEPDTTAYPVPWAPDREVRLCFLLGPDGAPSPACGRSTLARALHAAGREGYDVVAAAEVEFFLLATPGGDPVYDAIENYGIVAGARFERVLGQVRALRNAGVPVMASNPEYGGGQFEINLRHGAALQAADAVVLLRTWTGIIAAREGLAATFVAKRAPDASGSGMHVHQSLWRGDANAFWDDGRLSASGEGYLAGLLDGMAELAPLGSPTALGYTRRADGSFCPTSVCWGGDNRSVAVRVLVEEEPTTRIEQRDAAADASPYLAMAGQLTAGLRGIADGLRPPAAVEGNAYGRTDLPRLPRTLEEAAALFEGSDLAREVLGDEAHASLCGTLAAEVGDQLAGVGAGPDVDGAW
jgi:glutamine synthetase